MAVNLWVFLTARTRIASAARTEQLLGVFGRFERWQSGWCSDLSIGDIKQRFGALDFEYPETEVGAEIIVHETGVGAETAAKLVQVAHRARNLKGHGLDEGISTHLLVYAGNLIAKGIEPTATCRMTLVRPITDDVDMRETLDAAVATFF